MTTGERVAQVIESSGRMVYRTGKNVSRGWIALTCPYCEDPSAHLVINDSTGSWHCWRCSASGEPEHLLRKLNLVADVVCGGIDEPSLVRIVKDYFSPQPVKYDEPEIDEENKIIGLKDRFEREFLPLVIKEERLMRNSRVPRIVFDYLEGRGLSSLEEIYRLAVSYTDKGSMKYRIIFPIYYQGQLVTWLGRSIIKNGRYPRYKFLPAKESIIDFSALIWNMDYLASLRPNVLYVCEGVFDSISIGYGKATCTFRASLSPLQVLSLLKVGAAEYRLLYDPGALSQSIKAAERLSTVCQRVSVWSLKGTADLGDLSEPEREIVKVVDV